MHQEEMTTVAPYSETKPESQVPLPPYDSLPPPPYAFSSNLPQPSPCYRGAYYLYPPPGYHNAPSSSRHIYPPRAYRQNEPRPGHETAAGVPPLYKPAQTFFAHAALACVVTWTCNPLFGIVSFLLAILAQSYASSGNEAEARRLGQASLGISLAGILVLVILTIIFVVIAMA